MPAAKASAGARKSGSPDYVDRLTSVSLRGLAQMYVPPERTFVQTLRGVAGQRGPEARVEGRNLRYAAISALGLACVPEPDQARTLHGLTAQDLAVEVAQQATTATDPGAVALAAWAAAEVAGSGEVKLFRRLRIWLESGRPLPTVDVAWMVTAAVAARSLLATDDVAAVAALGRTRLLEAQGPTGVFPHALPAASLGRLRAHVGCFADQVYPIQALARLAAADGDAVAMRAANQCAAAICAVQGSAGQWWWHYDARDGSVVERFPVYSVHQHAMAPMTLFDLVESGGDDHTDEVLRGLDWLRTHPESFGELVDDDFGVIWRKVGRREPAKAARKLAAVTTSVRRGWQLPGVDRAMPANVVDHECRPYELGWLLYAWHAAPRADRLAPDAHDPSLRLVPARPPEHPAQLPGPGPRTERLFGMPVDAMTLAEVVGRCDAAIRHQTPVQIGVLNAAKVVRLRSDALLRNSLLQCEVMVADGMSVVWASRLLGRPLPERVAGIDLFQALLELADRDRRKVYLLGARPEVVAEVARVVGQRYPRATVVGSRDGYFTPAQAPQVAESIRESGADMLFLGMVSPKKEIFVGTYGPALGVPVVHGVGGSFDVLAGVTDRAPLAWQRAGMEWAYRLKQEPRRLARRYLTTNTAFLALTIQERMRPTAPFTPSAPPTDQELRSVS